MTRSVGLTDAAETTVYRAVGEYLVDGETRKVHAGLYDTAGPARQRVTWWRNHPTSRPSGGARPVPGVSWSLVDAWVEPVTVTNHPGVRFDESGHVTSSERLAAILQLSIALTDSLCGDDWSLAQAIRDLAGGEATPTGAYAFLGDGWEIDPIAGKEGS